MIFVFGGCGRHDDIPGGTSGFLKANGKPLQDVLVTVYPQTQSAVKALGIGVTNIDGRFELRTREPVGPLMLDPGNYRFTVHSLGEIYLVWPPEYLDPSKTPITQSISSSSEELQISVPVPEIHGF